MTNSIDRLTPEYRFSLMSIRWEASGVRLDRALTSSSVIMQMIEDLGIAGPADVGYYSGMVDSTFSYAQLFTASIRHVTLSSIVISNNTLHFFSRPVHLNALRFETGRFISGQHYQIASVVNPPL